MDIDEVGDISFYEDTGTTAKFFWDASAEALGIGTSSPSANLHVFKGESGGAAPNSQSSLVLENSSNTYIQFLTPASNESGLLFGDADNDRAALTYSHASDFMAFRVAAAERMRLDASGNLLVGTTTSFGGLINAPVTTTDEAIVTQSNSTSSSIHLNFRNPNGFVGSISTSSSATAYNTSSDYRLKDVDGPITNSGAYIDALKPVQGSWKADGSRFIGLIAHEVQEVSETQIATGEKDGEEMQAMDYSAPELIANLIAEIQSLRARVAQLEGV
jgi:hypothetical protein